MATDPEKLKTMVPWYHAKLDHIPADISQLLAERGIPEADMLEHVQTIRDKAWKLFPYPCIGMFSFLRLHLCNHPYYSSRILPLLKAGHNLLDLGSGFAVDFRSLVSAGVPGASLTAIDNVDGFWNFGKELFRDGHTLNAKFVVADMTDESSIPAELRGAFDMIWAGASFHLFDWEEQLKASVVAAKLLKDQKGSALYGYQVGRTTGSARFTGGNVLGNSGMFFHDPDTFEKLWEEVGSSVAMKFEVKSWMDDEGIDDLKKRDPELLVHQFAVTRVDGPVEAPSTRPDLARL